MDKLKMHSPDLTQANIERLAELFPNCVTEAQDKEGRVKRAIDFDLLRQELSDHIVEGPQERYHLNWPGKREALLAANAPIAKTLRPCREESVDFDTTRNLFIEGDNLEALKLLQETYLNQVKLIYIDPPYNTGTDFIYKDDFGIDITQFMARSNQVDASGSRLLINTETNGRFHSDWLSMIYSRVKLARSLLRDDGVIFISIDDTELPNLRKVCDEIFGEANFIANFAWEKRTNRENRKAVSYRHDNILCYCKSSATERPLFQLPMNEKALSNYKNPDGDPRGLWKSDPATAQAGHGTPSQFYELRAPSGKVHRLESGRCWVYTKSIMDREIRENKIWFGKDGNGVPRIKTYLDAKDRGLTPETILFAKDAGTNESAKNALKELFGGASVFETPKPVELIMLLAQMACRGGIFMDFFSGSSASAHAIMRLNAQDGGNRRFVLIQHPELCNEDSEAYKFSLFNVAEIGKERIRRAGRDLIDGDCHADWDKDIGFRVLKIDTSNMKEIYYTPDAITQDLLSDQVDNIREDRTPEDLLFQVLLDWGVDLTLPIERKAFLGKYEGGSMKYEEVDEIPEPLPSSFILHHSYFVDQSALIACFDTHIDEAFVKQLAQYKPLRVVFRDNGFASDSVKINVEQLFKLLSPSTEVKTL